MERVDVDLIIVGGSLLPALVALAARPAWRVALITPDARFGGGVIQPCFADDLPAEGLTLVEDAVVADWAGYHLLYPDRIEDHQRRILAFSPEQLHGEVLMRLPPDRLRHGVTGAISIQQGKVTLAQGDSFAAKAVLDLRAPPMLPVAPLIRIDSGGHFERSATGLAWPVLADATLVAEGAIRQYFPLAPDWLLVRAVSFAATMANVQFRAQPPAQGVEALRSTTMPFAGTSEGVALGTPHPLLPSAMPGALALALAIAGVADLSQAALGACLTRHATQTRQSLQARRAGLGLIATAPPEAMLDAALLAAKL